MRAIFISYRRDDAEGQAGRLFDDLVRQFGEGAVFMDVAGIEPGRDFRAAIDENVSSCGVLLAMIGKSWLDAKDESGLRRLDAAGDFVRLETASALKRDIPVVPVLVQGAKMPRAEQLPSDLADLAYRNGVELTHARWDSDVQALVKTLERHVKPNQDAAGSSAPLRSSKRTAIVSGLTLLAVVIGGYFWFSPSEREQPVAIPKGGVSAGESAPGGNTVDSNDSERTTDKPAATAGNSTEGIRDPHPANLDSIPAGTMLFYRHLGFADGSPRWAGTAKKIGEGWGFNHVFASDGGAIYAIQSDGRMLFYQHRGTTLGTAADWAIAGPKIGEAWYFKQVFAGDGGAIYAIQDDGTMLFYRHRGFVDGTAADWPIVGKKIGTGWNFKQVFAGDKGAIYAIQDDGTMLFYRHRGFVDGSEDWPVVSQKIGTAWYFKHVFAGDDGAIYAIQDDGTMFFYRHRGTVTGTSADWAVAGEKIGDRWNFTQVFAGNDGAIYAIK